MAAKSFRLKRIEPTEAQNQSAILRYLATVKSVAWAERANTGAHKADYVGKDGKKKSRFFRYGWKGCSDILGQLVDGRFLAIEVKTRTGRVRDSQLEFLDKVRDANGVAVLARSVNDVQEALRDAESARKECCGGSGCHGCGNGSEGRAVRLEGGKA